MRIVLNQMTKEVFNLVSSQGGRSWSPPVVPLQGLPSQPDDEPEQEHEEPENGEEG